MTVTHPAAAVPTHRAFLGWDAPALPRAASLLCDHYGRGDAIRMDAAVVVLPGARAGRRLKELLLEEAERRGSPLVPPRVATIGTLPELLHEPALPPAEPVLARLVWAEALRDAAPERLARVFRRRPEADALREWVQLGREVAGLQREVATAGLRFHDVAARCGDAPLHDDGERWRVLAEVQGAYALRLAGLGRSDPELARLDALDSGAVRTERELWLVAVAEMPEATRRMLRRLEAPPRVLVHAPEERAGGFDELGCVVPAAWLEAPVPLEEAQVAVVDRPEHQAAEAARTLASLGGGYAAEEIVVAVPDAEVVPFLEERLPAAGVPVRYAGGVPLSATGPYRVLRALADFVESRRFEALAALARHPDLAAWLGDAGGPPAPWLTPLDAYFGEHLPERVEGGLPGWKGREAVEALLQRLDGALAGRLEGRRRMGEQALGVLELLAEAYAAAGLDDGDAADRRTLEALERIGAAARALARLPEELDAPCPAATAVRLLLDECESEAIAPEAQAGAVELLGWLELHLDDAPVAVLTGVNESRLPESVSGDAFLPNGLRALLGLEDNDRRYARDAYQLTAVLRSRECVRVITGRRTAAGDPLRPSRLVLAVDDAELPRRLRRFYDGAAEGAGDAAVPASPAAPRASRFRLPPEPEIRLAEPIRTLRVTDFAGLIQDPYGWALSRVHGIEPLDDAAQEMDALVFGSLAHRVLERFGRSDAARLTDPGGVFDALDSLLREELRSRFGARPRAAVQVQAEQLRARLRAFARWQAEWTAAGWRIEAVECGTGEDGVAFEVDGEPVFLTARVDRVDRHPATGRWAVLDYKTGDRGDPPEATHRRGRGADKVWVDLQLPLYARILPSLRRGDGTPVVPPGDRGDVALGYVLLPRDLDAAGAALAGWTADELAAAEAVAAEAVRRLRAGVFRFDPEIRFAFPDPRLEALLGRGQLAGAAGDEEVGG